MPDFSKGEILSPVGSKEMLFAAVRSGADAVYFGCKEFSARRNAENFSVCELPEIIAYCHIRNVKAYLTLNILIKDCELSAAIDLAQKAYNAGIDGIIIQDLGLARILHKNHPQIPLHASTQMSIHSPACLPILKELGFNQVVVAREMSLDDLKNFCNEAQKYSITVEVFVHGALCMSMSGQCLLSAFLGSRSGNRGLCAGPCRLPFAAKGGTGYDLSLKDLSLTNYISDLYKIGVRSFKIEGRMKRPEYVAAATAACKESLLTGKVNTHLAEILKNVFSRSGFTNGYLENKLGRDMFGIRTKEDVISANKVFPILHDLYRKEYKSVPVGIKGVIEKNKPISLTLSDGKNTVTVKGNIPQPAKTKAISYEDTFNCLTKFGNTPYFDQGGTLKLDDGLFVSTGELNALRRSACEKLDTARAEIKHTETETVYVPQFADKVKNTLPDLIIRIEDKSQIPQNTDGIKAIIVPLEKDFEILKNIKTIVDIPRGIIDENLLKKRLLKFRNNGFDTCICGNLSAVKIAIDLGFNIIAGTGLNIHNTESANRIFELGAKATVLSCELTSENIKKLNSPIPKGIISYGNIPLMLFKNCPIKNGMSCEKCNKQQFLTDRLGTKFPVRCRMGYSELLNSVPIWLGDKTEDLRGCDFQILYFTNESEKQVHDIIKAFVYHLPPKGKYTRGLFYKGTV